MKTTGSTDCIFNLLRSLPYEYTPTEVVDRLREFPQQEVLPYLRELTLTHNNDAISARAIDAILQIDREFGRSMLLELWVRPDWEWFFCYAAIEFGDDAFVVPLCQILQNSHDPTTRYMAAIALERKGNLTAVESLTHALDDPGEDYEGRKISEKAESALIAIHTRAGNSEN
ncbi:MAG: HEAT repeat domain-containing protein [Caldilineaceae bacterium]|nr:HEAT repeat domain-containing protein [Caldilineaceae bacterium]